jgi:hypothetical protein
MPIVILRGSKNGHAVARLVLEGSSSNPVREAFLNGDPFEVSDEEFARLDRKYVLEPADDKSGNTEETSPEPEQGGGGDDQSSSRIVAASEQDET